MDRHEIAGGGDVYRFDTGPFNWYVIRQHGRLTVVDAGFPGHYATFLRGIRELGCEVKDVEAILLTHAHADHMGFAERLRRATNAPVYVHAEDLAAAQRVLQLPWAGLLTNSWRPFVSRILAHATFNGVFTMPRIAQARAMKAGEVLDVPGRPQVLHLPGHSPGEVAYYLPESSLLLSGDTLVTRNLFTGAHGAPQLTPPVLNHDNQAARRSLDHLRELGTLTMLPGHGTAWRGCMADGVDAALQTHRH